MSYKKEIREGQKGNKRKRQSLNFCYSRKKDKPKKKGGKERNSK